MPEVAEGDTVAFVPGLCHSRDRDARGDFVFEFVHLHDAPNTAHCHKKGDKACLELLGSINSKDGAKYDHDTHCLHTAGGHVVKAVKPKGSWQATVLRVGADGKAELLIQHPHGHTLEYPGVPYSATGDLHTWHLPKGA